MERLHHCSPPLFLSAIVATSLVSFALCLVAEFKKSKKGDLRLDGKRCYLPGSDAFGSGIAALICLSMAQIIATLFICTTLRSKARGGRPKVRKRTIPWSLLFFSWISFGIAVILIGGASCMSRSQDFGEEWLDGELLFG